GRLLLLRLLLGLLPGLLLRLLLGLFLRLLLRWRRRRRAGSEGGYRDRPALADPHSDLGAVLGAPGGGRDHLVIAGVDRVGLAVLAGRDDDRADHDLEALRGLARVHRGARHLGEEDVLLRARRRRAVVALLLDGLLLGLL